MANKEELQGIFEDKATSIVTNHENFFADVASVVRERTDCKKMEEQFQEIDNLLNKYKEGLAMIKEKLQKE